MQTASKQGRNGSLSGSSGSLPGGGPS